MSIRTVGDASAAITCTQKPEGGFSIRINRFAVSYSQGSYGGIRHFPTLEEAQADYDKQAREVRAQCPHGVQAEEIAPAGWSLKGERFRPLRKNRKPGTVVITMYVLRLERSAEDMAEILRYFPNAE